MAALPNPSFQPKNHRWRPGAGAAHWEVPSQNCAFCAPNLPFLAPEGPRNLVKTTKGRDTFCTPHVRPEFLVTKSPFLPSNSAICPRNGPKRAENGVGVKQPQNQERAVSWATWLKTKFPGHLVHPPLFVVSKPQIRPTRRLHPRTRVHLVEPEGSPACARWVPTVGPPGSPGRKKSLFPKLFLDHLGCANKWF